MFAVINETVSRHSRPVLPPFHVCRWSDWRVRGPLFVSPSMTSMCQGNRGEASYTRAYERLRTNKGAMTPGVTGETVDDMSMGKIGTIIDAVRHERYRWTPVKRVYIPKKGGKTRPLGLPTWSDKLLQEVMRSVLETYYEPQFSDRSHGFRPNRGCHTALEAVRQTWTGTRWFIEGDIAQCYDRLDHAVLLAILAENLRDNRFLRLLSTMLKAGYVENWTHHATPSGAPQGGVVSPILSNVYLDRLDTFVETTLLSAYNRGERRQYNPDYARIASRLRGARARGDANQAHELEKQRRTVPYGDPQDPHYRRLTYLRYADDFLLGFIGPKAEAEEIKDCLRAYLRDTLKLELSEDKTLITHARSTPARFLRLRNPEPTPSRQARPSWPALCQRHRCAPGAGGCRRSALPPLHAPRGTGAPRGALPRQRLRHREQIPDGVPGPRPVLPAGDECASAVETDLCHGNLTPQDPRRETSDDGQRRCAKVQGDHGDAARADEVSARDGGPWGGAATIGGGVRWYTAATRDSPHDCRRVPEDMDASHGPASAHASRRMRAMRMERRLPRPPYPQDGRPPSTGTPGKTRVGQAHDRSQA